MVQFEEPLEITAIGGGHGLAGVAEALGGEYSGANITALSTVVDSGSTTGKVGEMLGELGAGRYGLGDLRNVLARVSSNEGGELFAKRFSPEDDESSVERLNQHMLCMLGERGLANRQAIDVMEGAIDLAGRLGEVRGHTYGNLVLGSLCLREELGLVSGLELANKWLGTKAHVQTITDHPHHLGMWDNGSYYYTEAVVDGHRVEDPEGAYIGLDTLPEITDKAYEAIANADIVIVAPGSLWTSTLPALAVEGVAKALQEQSGQGGSRLIVANLVEEPNAGAMPLASYVQKIEGLTGVDFGVVYNTAVDPDSIPPRYKPLSGDELADRGFGAALVSTEKIKLDPNDPLAGTPQRSTAPVHNSRALAHAIAQAYTMQQYRSPVLSGSHS